MGNSTIYDVKLRYGVESGNTTKSLSSITQHADKAAKSTGFLSSHLGKLGVAAGAFFGVSAAKESLIGFNSNMEKAKITMAGLFEMNLGGEFADNMGRADTLVAALQQRMKSAAGTTAEAVDMAAMLSQGFAKAGMSMKDMENMTVGAVVGAKAMGIAAEVAARDIDQALRGQFKSVDQFTGKLLGAKEFGFQGEEGRSRFNALDTAKRADILRRALDSKALHDMAEAQASSWEGVTSTLEDGIQMALGKVGLPLFKAMTKEIQSWNAWMDSNSTAIESMTKTLSDGLVAGFGYAKSAIQFLIDNKDTLMRIATMWLAMKGARAVGGVFSDISGALNKTVSAFSGLNTGMANAPTNMGAFVNNLGTAALALGALYTAASFFADWVNEKHDKTVEKRAAGNAFLPLAAKNMQDAIKMGPEASELLGYKESANIAFKLLKQQNAVSDDGTINRSALTDMVAAMGDWDRQQLARSLGSDGQLLSKDLGTTALVDRFSAQLKEIIPAAMDKILMDSETRAKEASATKLPDKVAEKTKLNVKIEKIEVQSDDPDRFVFNMVSAFEDAAKNGSFNSDTISQG